MKEIKASIDLLNEIDNIEWFVNCGNQMNSVLLCSVEQVDGWESAEEYDEQDEWEEVISNNREKLVEFVINKLGYSTRNFNDVVSTVTDSPQFKSAVSKLQDAIEEKNIKEDFESTLRWLLINAATEGAFSSFKGCPNFFREMLKVMKYGHIPCGWNGRWPKGTLYIY